MTVLFLCILSYSGHAQHDIQLKIFMNDTLVSDIDQKVLLTFKFKGNKDTLRILSGKDNVSVPAMDDELEYFEISYKGFHTFMTEVGAEMEGKHLFKNRENLQIKIDNYPFSSLSIAKYGEKLRMNSYTMIFADFNDSNPQEDFGFFYVLGQKSR